MTQILHHKAGGNKARELPSADELRNLFIYDGRTGRLFWKRTSSNPARSGTEAGHCKKSKGGYREVQIKGAQYREHRIIWVLWHGAAPTGHIDHINGIRDDNRIENLRDVTVSVNLQNLRSAKSNNRSTGLLGAYKSGGRIWSSIMVDGKSTFLGNFKTAQEAHEAYVAAKRKLHEGCSI